MKLTLFFFIAASWVSGGGAAETPLPGRLPNEFESNGGHGLGFGHGGMAAVSEQSSVRMNPAMLPFERQYRVSGGYHWPTFGRDFYQVGVVDSKTAAMAAGLTYTAGTSKYRDYTLAGSQEQRELAFYDSPIRHRVALGIAQSFDKFSIGMGGQYVEAPLGLEETTKGVTLGAGMAGLLTPLLRFGLSVENLGNAKVREISPTIYRAGLAYTLFGGDMTLHADYHQRQRVLRELLVFGAVEPKPDVKNTPERMVTGSASVRIQNLIRLMAAYGQSVDGISRRSLSGGVAVVNQNFSLSYLVSRPFFTDEKVHQAVNAGIEMTL
jgi:hypothetical protein